MRLTDPFTLPKFDWSRYLQRHLVWGGVNVSDLHPIMGLRLSALFIDLTNNGMASDVPGKGLFQITSGVRSKAQQIALYNDICLRQGRCSMVANPFFARSSGPDQEGVLRHGSNHMAQAQDPRWGVSVGHAVDIRNSGTPWSRLHERLAGVGLDWPLRFAPYEPWHVEAFPDRSPHLLGWVKGPWPRRPGIHRPLMTGMLGGDVRRLQRMLDIERDASFGPGTAKAVRKTQRTLRQDRTGIWDVSDQRAWERDRRRRLALR